jgi:hypothetical protein
MAASVGKIVSDLSFPFWVTWGLLHDNPVGTRVPGDEEHFGPEGFSGSLPGNSGSNACSLTRGASNNKVGPSEV